MVKQPIVKVSAAVPRRIIGGKRGILTLVDLYVTQLGL